MTTSGGDTVPAVPRGSIALWDFAVGAYARPGVAPLCLRLQDEHGLDVDVLLACLWLASEGQAVDEPKLEAMRQAAEPVSAMVQRIRAVRRTIGTWCELDSVWEPTYDHLKDSELAAERVELDRLEAALTPRQPAAEGELVALALDGLRRYARSRAVDSSDAMLEQLASAVLGSALPGRP